MGGVAGLNDDKKHSLCLSSMQFVFNPCENINKKYLSNPINFLLKNFPPFNYRSKGSKLLETTLEDYESYNRNIREG